jgi:hypothetical protein
MEALYKTGSGYANITVTRPETLGYSLADSPAGLEPHSDRCDRGTPEQNPIRPRRH